MQEMIRPDIVQEQKCPFCFKETMTLTEAERDIPFFGKVYLFSMTCMNCKYHKADLECADKKDPCRYTFEVESTEDLGVRVIKSAGATVKIPFMITMESSETSIGYITNIEGLLNRVKRILESAREDAEDSSKKKKLKNMLKKLHKVVNGQEKLKIIIEDKAGNSAIISERAERKNIKV